MSYIRSILIITIVNIHIHMHGSKLMQQLDKMWPCKWSMAKLNHMLKLPSWSNQRYMCVLLWWNRLDIILCLSEVIQLFAIANHNAECTQWHNSLINVAMHIDQKLSSIQCSSHQVEVIKGTCVCHCCGNKWHYACIKKN